MKWEPWNIQSNGPPCRECRHWKPQFKYFPDGTHDGIRCCQAENMWPDFSCFTSRIGELS